MSRASRDKGNRIEHQIVALHAELGIKAERVPLSGAARYQGNGADIDVYARRRCGTACRRSESPRQW
jgi:Holliday junction resolvase